MPLLSWSKYRSTFQQQNKMSPYVPSSRMPSLCFRVQGGTQGPGADGPILSLIVYQGGCWRMHQTFDFEVYKAAFCLSNHICIYTRDYNVPGLSAYTKQINEIGRKTSYRPSCQHEKSATGTSRSKLGGKHVEISAPVCSISPEHVCYLHDVR